MTFLRRAGLVVVVVAFLLLALARVAHGSQPAAYDTITVKPGDTVWSIATQRYPDADPRERVEVILEANHLARPVVYPGQQLRVPAAGS
ncbi:MAG TPA: LysM peptidoglycan-binding domain-containing protein [Candidatus Dormibacteraeota bacterium]